MSDDELNATADEESGMEPWKLIDDAIVLSGLIQTLHMRLEESASEDGISDAMNLSWSFDAVAQLATALAKKIMEHAD